MADTKPEGGDDAACALRFMLVKTAIFIGVPMLAALAAALTIILR